MKRHESLSRKAAAGRAVPAIGVGLVLLFSYPVSAGRRPDQRSLSPSLEPRMAPPVRPDADFGKIPLQFIPNLGQTDSQVAFYAQGLDKRICFTPEGLTFILERPARHEGESRSAHEKSPGVDTPQRWVVKQDFVGSNRGVKPVGLELSGAALSYFKGKPEEWKTGLKAYSKIAYRDLWPGIDLVYTGTSDRMKYEFIVRPGGDPKQIGLACRGAQDVRLTSEGRLEIITPAGTLQDDTPVAYQEIGGKRVSVPVSYVLSEPVVDSPGAGPAIATVTCGFEVGNYDGSRPLIIDPDLLVFCGFVGGAGAESVCGIQGAVIAGTTSSAELTFPVTAGPDLTYNGGDADVFVAMLNESGTALEYCFYLGGSGLDVATDMVFGYPSVFVTGYTTSTEASFPVKVGPDLTYNGGESDAFVARVDLHDSSLVFCGYIGGSERDEALSIGYQPALFEGDPGALCVAGWTSSTEASFPVKVGPDLAYNGGESDAFITEIHPSGQRHYYCGYIGGSGRDVATAVMYPPPIVGIYGEPVYFMGHPCVVGWTSSAESSFPVLDGPDLTYNGGESDAFVARVELYGRYLDFCGYIGGEGSDQAWCVHCDEWMYDMYDPAGSGAVTYIGGSTSSTESTFPVACGPDVTYNGGDSDAFIFKMFGLTLQFGGYIGGEGSDVATNVARGTNDSFCRVVGWTSSAETTFPVAWGPDLTYNGGPSDAFIAEVHRSDLQLLRCGYIGGAGADRALGLWVTHGQGSEEAYIAGVTDSSEATFPVNAGPDLTYNGGESDGFVARIAKVRPALISFSPPYAAAGSPGFELVITGIDFLEGAVVWWWDHTVPTEYVSDSELHAAIDAADLAVGNAVDVNIENPDGSRSNILVFEVRNPVPVLTSISPVRATGGGGAFNLAAVGAGFVPNAAVLWNGGSRWTTYLSGTELRAEIPASDLTAAGDFQIEVINPVPTPGPSNAVAFTVSGFALASSNPSATVTAGQTATYSVQVTPEFGAFDAPVAFSCTGLPAKCTASFSPSSVTPGAAAASTTLTLATQGSSISTLSALDTPRGGAPLSAVLLSASLLTVISLASLKPALVPRRRWVIAASILLVVVMIAACGVNGHQDDEDDGKDDNRTPRGTYQVTVSGTSGGMSSSTVVVLTVQ